MSRNDNRSTTPLTPVEVARFNTLSKQFDSEMNAALKLCQGNAAMACALMYHERGILSAEKALQRIKQSLRLPTPIIASAEEHFQLAGRLYRARPLGTASEPKAGD